MKRCAAIPVQEGIVEMKRKRRLLSALLCLGVLSLTLTAGFTASAEYGYAMQGSSSSEPISLEHEAMALNVGDEVENPVLQWVDGGGNIVLTGFLWQSSNDQVAWVSPEGRICAVAPGIARLTAEGELQGNPVSLSCDVAVAGRTDDGVCIKAIIQRGTGSM